MRISVVGNGRESLMFAVADFSTGRTLKDGEHSGPDEWRSCATCDIREYFFFIFYSLEVENITYS